MNKLEMYIDSEIEYGLRALILVSVLGDCELSFEKLLVYDYMLTNFNDFDSTYESVNPDTSYRLAKLIVKRQAYKGGLNYCIIKNLIDINYTSRGILYTATSITTPFIDNMNTTYLHKLKRCASQIRDVFGCTELEDLQRLIDEKVREHGIVFRTSEG